MRRPAILKQSPNSRRAVSSPSSVPAPVGGLNALDSIADMGAEFAVIMKNWWPTTSDIMVRKGQTAHVTGFAGQVESFMPYVKPDGTEALFCAEGTDFFDITTAGSVGTAVQSSLTNARWTSINFANTSGTSFLCCFNGVDSPRYWDNSNWVTINASSTPAITGVTTSDLRSPWVHQRRMWMIQKDSLTAWYLPVDAVGGEAKALNMAGLFQKGGHLIAGGTYTMDAGLGPDDYWYAITSEGEIISFSGTDVTSLATWRLVGVWNVGQPIGDKCLLKFRGDALIVLREGVFSLSAALISATTDKSKAITNNIKDAINNVANLYSNNFGWELVFYSDANMLILNVPIDEGKNQIQYAMNIITGSWTLFEGVEANAWVIFNGEPYFGGDKFVNKFWDTFADKDTDIDTDLEQAFSYFGNRGTLKSFKMIKPYLFTNGSPSILADIALDFRDEAPTSSLTSPPSIYGTWDSSKWDNSLYGGQLNIMDEWQHCSGIGTSAALRMQTSSNKEELRLKATDYLYERGGIIG